MLSAAGIGFSLMVNQKKLIVKEKTVSGKQQREPKPDTDDD